MFIDMSSLGGWLLASRVDSGDAIKRPFDRMEHPVTGRGAAAEHAGQVRTEHRARHEEAPTSAAS
jgi:hypothetical protein